MSCCTCPFLTPAAATNTFLSSALEVVQHLHRPPLHYGLRWLRLRRSKYDVDARDAILGPQGALSCLLSIPSRRVIDEWTARFSPQMSQLCFDHLLNLSLAWHTVRVMISWTCFSLCANLASPLYRKKRLARFFVSSIGDRPLTACSSVS